MGVYVTDGILLGAVIDPKRIKRTASKYFSSNEILDVLSGAKAAIPYSIDDAKMNLSNVIKMNGETAEAICQENDPYNEESEFYLGIFWEWSNRAGMNLDDKWRPLFFKKSEIDEKHDILKQRIYDVASKIIKDLKESEISLYEVRFFD